MATEETKPTDILSGSKYKKSTEQERFARQVERDISRKSVQDDLKRGNLPTGRLSQSTLKKLIGEDTSSWANKILSEKIAANSAVNSSASAQQSTIQASVQTSAMQVPQDMSDAKSGSNALGSSAQSEAPAYLIIDICKDGNPRRAMVWGYLLPD